MPTEGKYEAPAALQTYLTTQLNALADGGNKLGAKIDNVANVAGENELFLDLELFVAAQGVARDAGAYVAIYILYSVDDTNFCYGSDSVDPPASALLHVFNLDVATAARYVTIVDLPIGPLDFKLLVMNETGQVFAATLNTLKYRLHSLEMQNAT